MAIAHKPLVLIDGEMSELPADGYIERLEEDVPQRQEVDFAGEEVTNPTDLTFSSIGNTITTAGGVDWTAIGFEDENTIIITNTDSNDGAYTISGDPTLTVLTVIEPLIDEGAGDASATIRSNSIVYKGWADLNSLTSANVWKIQRIKFVGADEDAEFKWVNDALYTEIWNNRTGLIYS